MGPPPGGALGSPVLTAGWWRIGGRASWWRWHRESGVSRRPPCAGHEELGRLEQQAGCVCCGDRSPGGRTDCPCGAGPFLRAACKGLARARGRLGGWELGGTRRRCCSESDPGRSECRPGRRAVREPSVPSPAWAPGGSGARKVPGTGSGGTAGRRRAALYRAALWGSGRERGAP